MSTTLERTAAAGTTHAGQLRNDIDSGRTGDKVAAPDPAAAPLGTDDEAAGRPPSAAEVAEARRLESRSAAAHPAMAANATKESERRGQRMVLMALTALVLCFVVALLVVSRTGPV